MKKSWLKKGVSIGLAFTMMLGLAACGRRGGTVSADPNLAKQYVYSCQEVDIPQMGDGFDIRSGCYMDGRIYLLANVYDWESTGNQQTVKLLSLSADGTDVQEIALEMPASSGNSDGEDGTEGNAEDTEGEAETGAEEEQPADEGEDADMDGEIAVMPMPRDAEANNTYEYTGFGNYVFTEDGKLYAIKTYSFEDYSDPENYVSKREDSVCAWDLSGSLLSEAPLEAIDNQVEYLYVNALVPMKDGSLSILYTGDSVQSCNVGTDGTVSPRKPLSDDSAAFRNGANIMVKGAGELLVTYYDENDWSKMYIASFDMETGVMGEPTLLPSSFTTGGYNMMTAGSSTDLIYADNNGIYTLNVGDDQTEQMMSYVNSDLNVGNMNTVIELDENRFIGLYYDSISYESQVGLFTKVNPEDIPDKEVLVLAGNYVGSDVKQEVIAFNKNNDKYRIVIKEYRIYNTSEDYRAGYTQLNNDIISGNMPDILMTDTSFPLQSYIAKGLLADVGNLIEKDEELSQAEFMQNVFDAYSVDGKLYEVIPSFNVMTMMAKRSHVGDRTSWTMKDLQEVMAAMPEGAAAMGETTKSNFIYMMMQYCGTDFVDVSTGKCAFDSQNFIDMLEYANTLPAELADDYYDDEFWQNYESQYREDRTLLMNTYISSVRDMNSVINGSFGEPVSFIGFPTESGNGSSIFGGDNMALSAKSKNLDGAWQFARRYLLEDYQKELQWGLPTRKSVFDEKAKEALNKPYYIDEKGEKVEYNESVYINGESIELAPMTQEQIDEVVSFISSIKTRQFYNEDVNNIITEEAEAFFTGQKSAQEVAGIIQSRVQIYVSENM